MSKPPSIWTKLFEKHTDHPDVTPRVDLNVIRQILLIGVPILLLLAAISWFLMSR
jgi:hypothetical protein